MFSIEHRDMGGTLQTSIYFGAQLIVEYLPGTKHANTADDVAEQVVADALRPLFQVAVEANGCQPPITVDELPCPPDGPAD